MAGVANHPHSVASSVLEKDNLLFFVQGLANALNEEIGEHTLHLMPFARLYHVHHPDVGQLALGKTLHQFHQAIFVLLYIVIAFQ